MASHVFVIDSTARRQQIKTTPNTYLRDILEEACKKFNKNNEQFVLSDNGRPPRLLDLSLTVRHAGLVNGTKLQLTQASRSPTIINVALKLPPILGDVRLQDKFPSNTPIWMILRKFEDGVAGGGQDNKLNLTQRSVPSTPSGAGRLEYEQPIIKIIQRELTDFVSLQKTLAQLGFNSGSILIQLEYRNSGMPMEEALSQISSYFNQTSNEDKNDIQEATPPTDPVIKDKLISKGDEDNMTETTQSEMDLNSDDKSTINSDLEVVETEPIANGRPEDEDNMNTSNVITDPITGLTTSADENTQPPSIIIYKPPSSSTPQAALQPLDDNDFLPTIEHAQSHQSTLSKAAHNKRLLSDIEIEAMEQQKQADLKSIQKITIRIRFPDQMQIDLNLDSSTTIKDLYNRVREMLYDSSLNFELKYTGQKGLVIINETQGEKSLIKDVGLKGRILVTMIWDKDVSLERRRHVLKDSLVNQAQDLIIPDMNKASPMSSSNTQETPLVQEEKKQPTKKDVEAKMKKFLGFGKK